MKRKLAAVMVAIMVLCFATTVFAAGSSKAGSQVKGAGEAISEVEAGIPDPKPVAEAEDSSAVLVDMFDLSAEDPSNVTIYNPAFVAGHQILVLHYNGTEWEVVGTFTAEKGKVTVDFSKTGLSPVAFFDLDAEDGAAATSPTTGESAVLPVLVMICACGVFFCTKKARA